LRILISLHPIGQFITLQDHQKIWEFTAKIQLGHSPYENFTAKNTAGKKLRESSLKTIHRRVIHRRKNIKWSIAERVNSKNSNVGQFTTEQVHPEQIFNSLVSMFQ
jgi:hypothetical protein